MDHRSTRRGRVAACVVLSVLTSGLVGPAWAAAKDEPAPSPTRAANEAGVRRATLDNGLKVVVVPNRLAPAVTTVMNYDVGSRDVPEGFPGMAHAQEHMMFRGTDTLSASQISAISAAMGGQFNADTQDEVTQYYFTVPAPYLDVALRLHAERMKSVKDAQEDWAKERGAIEQEVARDLSSPDYVAYTRLREQLFDGTPYAHDALGTKPSFDATTGKMLKAFHDKWYAPNNATLVIAGDVDAKATLATVQKLFGDIPRQKLPKTAPIKLSPVKDSAIRMPTDAGYGLAYLAFRAPGTDDAPQHAAAQVLAQVLSNPRGALYSQLVATGKSLGTQFAVEGLRAAGTAYAVAAFPAGADSDTLVTQMRTILADIGDKGVDNDAIEAAKRQLVTQAAAEQDSIPGQAMAWSQAVAVDRMASPQAELDALQNVTPAAVNALARQMLAHDNSVLTVLTPESSGAPASSSGFGGGESFTPSHVDDVTLPDWAAKPLASIDVPEQTTAPIVSRLDNGLRLIVVPSDATRAVHVYGSIRNNPDLQAPKGQDGVDAVLDRLLSFGTQKHDRVAYQAALDAIGADTSAGTDFSMVVLPEHFEQGLDLLAENELAPALRKKAFDIVKRQIAAATAGTLDSPDFHADQAMKIGLYPKDDPSLRHPTPDSVDGLSYADLTQYYDQVFRPDLTTIVVVGDVDAAAAKKAVTKSFGDWHAQGDTPRVDLPPVPANKAASTRVPDSARVQDTVRLAETVGLHESEPDYYALQVGNQVLTGGFYASRLYRELRAERGLVYYVHSSLQADRTRTHLAFEYGALPDKVATANRLIADALTQMAAAPVSADELHRAQAEMVRQIALNQASADAIGGGLLSRIDRGVPLDEPYRAAAAYKTVDAKAIQAAFKRWIRPDDLVHVVQGPAPK
ncbi:M16 family metallopeptidase [Salinisphaera aquimarina]|uniref:M16 family metallopeptidase n=1 Tax=Salinisphaera aquimarina TaxID=2094031 RepID=A0ABV7EPW3_9GAMM